MISASPKGCADRKNVGLYNGFLAAGLIWGLFPGQMAFPIGVFSPVVLIIAGVFGAITLPKPTTLFIQSLPAAIAFALTYPGTLDHILTS